MRLLVPMLAALLLLSGCVSRAVIPHQAVPHRVSKESTATVWAQRPDGRWVETEVRLLPGWWIASPLVVETTH